MMVSLASEESNHLPYDFSIGKIRPSAHSVAAQNCFEYLIMLLPNANKDFLSRKAHQVSSSATKTFKWLERVLEERLDKVPKQILPSKPIEVYHTICIHF